jgi:hypothetical protein
MKQIRIPENKEEVAEIFLSHFPNLDKVSIDINTNPSGNDIIDIKLKKKPVQLVTRKDEE